MSEDLSTIEINAKKYNSVDIWNKLWSQEGFETWRGQALKRIYDRIEYLIPSGSNAVDLGGGVGVLAKQLLNSKLMDRKGDPLKINSILVIDHSPSAIKIADEEGLVAICENLNQQWFSQAYQELPVDVVLATEFMEHLDSATRHCLLEYAAKCGKAFISVPNNRLGPDEEPQHTIKFTAKSFLDELHKYFCHARVEVIGPYLLGICGFNKEYSLSVCMPVRNEEHDIEATLASFRGVADQLVVGIDPRSTDNTREISSWYADLVFTIENPTGPKEDNVPETGVHFAWVRNQCMNKCTGDWIFMTEGHERLVSGEDTLLHLKTIAPESARIAFVLRTGDGQQWAFPWLCQNAPDLRYKRCTHNVLDYPDGSYVVQLPQIRTLHERHVDASNTRAIQRKAQNRKTLLDDWMHNKNENSLHYLGAEWRGINDAKAIDRLEEFLHQPAHNGPMRYHTRLLLAKLYTIKASETDNAEEKQKWFNKVRLILITAAADDWSRIEHWLWLGDIAFIRERYEEALQFYRYAGTRAGDAPFTLWWVDLSMYSYLPAQRLAMIYAELGQLENSLLWAQKVKELLPEDAPEEMFKEADNNIALLTEAMNHD